MKKKYYRLLKIYPYCVNGSMFRIPAGTISDWQDDENYYFMGCGMPKKYVENNPDWFEYVAPEEGEDSGLKLLEVIQKLESQGCDWKEVIWLVDDGKITKQAKKWGSDIIFLLEQITKTCESYSLPIDKICITPKPHKTRANYHKCW